MSEAPKDTAENNRNTPEHRAARDKLVEEHLPLVKRLARKKHRRIPANITCDELLSAGNMGLLRAADTYDETRSKFTTHAIRCVSGAMNDYLRQIDPFGRDLREMMNKAGKFRTAFLAEHRRSPDDDEIAGHLGMEVERYRDRVLDSIAANPVLASAMPMNEDMPPMDFAGDPSMRPDVAFIEAEPLRRIREAVAKLPAGSQKAVKLYFEEGLTHKEIGKQLGIVKTGASERLRTALKLIRAGIDPPPKQHHHSPDQQPTGAEASLAVRVCNKHRNAPPDVTEQSERWAARTRKSPKSDSGPVL